MANSVLENHCFIQLIPFGSGSEILIRILILRIILDPSRSGSTTFNCLWNKGRTNKQTRHITDIRDSGGASMVLQRRKGEELAAVGCAFLGQWWTGPRGQCRCGRNRRECVKRYCHHTASHAYTCRRNLDTRAMT